MGRGGGFQVGLAQAMLAADPHAELEQLKSLSTFLAKPLAGMNESVRGFAQTRPSRSPAWSFAGG